MRLILAATAAAAAAGGVVVWLLAALAAQMVYTQDKLGMGICAAVDERNLPQISYVPGGVTRPQVRDYLEAVIPCVISCAFAECLLRKGRIVYAPSFGSRFFYCVVA